MNILFVLYGDFTSNSVNPLALYARKLHELGHRCCVAVPRNLDSVSQCPDPTFRAALYADVLAHPESVFSDGRPADVIHAWTPREVVREFVTAYMATRPTPLTMYLEDHESWITCRVLDLEDEALAQQTDRQISERMPDSLSHPFRYDSFVGLADSAAVIQDKLRIEVPPWVSCATVMPPVDLHFFSPRPSDPVLRKKYGVEENERVIVYPGGLNSITRHAIKTLCDAVCLINQQGVRCRLLRTGPFALDFLDQLPPELAWSVTDLGVVDRRSLPDLLSLADVFVQPGSIDAFEDLRLPGKLPELLAMGRPVVMPDVNIAHMFNDGVDAVLTRTGSAEEIAARCIELFSNPERADRIGQAGRRFAEKHFDPDSKVEQMARIYEVGRDHFDPAIAAEVWSPDARSLPVATLLARKLRLMAGSKHQKFHFRIPELLTEHARYIALVQSRLTGLEAGIVERETQAAGLIQAVNNAETQAAGLIEAVHDGQVEIDNLARALVARDGRIDGLTRALIDRDEETRGILASLSWRLTRPFRIVESFFRNRFNAENAPGARSEWFDAAWYLEQNPDVAAAGMDPYEHYVIFGKPEGRPPAPTQ